MASANFAPSIEQSYENVKYPINTQLPLFLDTMIHHKEEGPRSRRIVFYRGIDRGKHYGVSSASRVLPVSLFRKKYELVQSCLKSALGLSHAQVEATMRLIRLQCYYGTVYPKAQQVADGFQEFPPKPFVPYPGYLPPLKHRWGCSRATFWRTINHLKGLGLITVINRYIMRPHAQISNLYKLDKLLIIIAKYLAEHTGRLWPKWVEPYLSLTWPKLWDVLRDAGRYDVPPLHLSILPL